MKSVTHNGDLVARLNAFLADDLARVDAHILAILDSDTQLVRQVGHYLRDNQGKRLRPILAILSSRAFGYEGTDHAKVAAALELVHTATLLHDDVIDKAPLRRGTATVNAHWGDDVAILIADYLYSEAFYLAHDALPPEVIRLICKVTAKMCEGELFQIEKRSDLLTRDDYLRIVRSKTAYLFSACTSLGSVLAGATEAESAQLAGYGMNFGIAFQITDDTLDMAAGSTETGKQHWTDIRNGKQTLPLIHTFAVAEPRDRQELLSCWNNGRDAEQIMTMIRKYRGIEYALGEAREFASTAREQLAALPPTVARDLMCEISDYVVSRTA